MADKKTNDILEEQRRARQEFLNLKKMQQGEMDAGPKPSEVATVLKTPKEKFKNFWDYSKWFVISGIAIAVVISVLVAQCVNRPSYDLKLVYFTYNAMMDEQIKPIEEYLSKYGKDIDGDGEFNIQVINCSLSNKGNANIMMRNTMYQKLQSIIVAEKNALLFIMDEESVKYFDNLEGGMNAMFDQNSVSFGEDFYTETKHESFGTLPEGLTLYCRKVSEIIKDEDGIAEYFNVSQDIINGVKEKNANN